MQDDRHLLPGYGLTVVKIAACRRDELPFPAKTIAAVKAPMCDDTVGGMTLCTTTCTHQDDDGSGNVWWIGGI